MSASGNLDGHLGEGTEVTGTLRFEGSVRIDGKFKGKILSPASLILGPKALVDGELQVGELAVHGALRGQVRAAGRVTIHSSGKVEAEIKTRTLVVEPGAYFQGNCDMEREAKPAVPGPAAGAGGAGAPAAGNRSTPSTAAPDSQADTATSKNTPEQSK